MAEVEEGKQPVDVVTARRSLEGRKVLGEKRDPVVETLAVNVDVNTGETLIGPVGIGGEVSMGLSVDVLLDRCREIAPKRRLKFKNALLSLDSTVIDLGASLFDWAKFRKTKGGVKVHVLLDNQGLLPGYALITDAKTSDIRAARTTALLASFERNDWKLLAFGGAYFRVAGNAINARRGARLIAVAPQVQESRLS